MHRDIFFSLTGPSVSLFLKNTIIRSFFPWHTKISNYPSQQPIISIHVIKLVKSFDCLTQSFCPSHKTQTQPVSLTQRFLQRRTWTCEKPMGKRFRHSLARFSHTLPLYKHLSFSSFLRFIFYSNLFNIWWVSEFFVFGFLTSHFRLAVQKTVENKLWF